MTLICAIILTIHGLIHLMGFVKAFASDNLPQLTREVSKPVGVLWLITALVFILATLMLLLNNAGWVIPAIIAVAISQILVFSAWHDAKFGTLANLIILAAVGLSLGSYTFEAGFRKDVKTNLVRTNEMPAEMLTEADLQGLPSPVQRYMRYAGVVDKPKVKNVRIVFEGKMREKGKDWFAFTTLQYNFFDEPTRLFFMKGKKFGVTIPGYHRYVDAKATMDIRLFGLFPLIRKSGEFMDKTETVTLFNDMCLMAPSTLIDKRIQWEVIDSNSVKAIFSNHGITISAILYFNAQGQLVDFRSEDRTSISYMKQYPFTTPVSAYKNVNGFNVPTDCKAIWHYPHSEFVYGKFILKKIEYNVKDFENE